jgi:hypothetical protein
LQAGSSQIAAEIQTDLVPAVSPGGFPGSLRTKGSDNCLCFIRVFVAKYVQPRMHEFSLLRRLSPGRAWVIQTRTKKIDFANFGIHT